MNNLCPVCRMTVTPTVRGVIRRHLDSLGRDVCPGSGERFDLTVTQSVSA